MRLPHAVSPGAVRDGRLHGAGMFWMPRAHSCTLGSVPAPTPTSTEPSRPVSHSPVTSATFQGPERVSGQPGPRRETLNFGPAREAP